jgi:hypothetical protein
MGRGHMPQDAERDRTRSNASLQAQGPTSAAGRFDPLRWRPALLAASPRNERNEPPLKNSSSRTNSALPVVRVSLRQRYGARAGDARVRATMRDEWLCG